MALDSVGIFTFAGELCTNLTEQLTLCITISLPLCLGKLAAEIFQLFGRHIVDAQMLLIVRDNLRASTTQLKISTAGSLDIKQVIRNHARILHLNKRGRGYLH
eukprot:scpid34833/ scgid25642/ 